MSRRVNSTSKAITEDAVQLCAHGIYGMPKCMQDLDPRRIHFELVIQATVKYYLTKGGQIQPGSAARLEMPHLTVPFLPSSIFFQKEKFIVDLERLRGSGTGSPQHPPTGDLHHSPSSASLKDLRDNGASKVTWRYPVPPPGVAVVFEVFVGVKERRVGSSTSSWVSTGGAQQQGGSSSDPQGYRFVVPASAVMEAKVATRMVGLSIGQVALTITIPPPESTGYCTSNAMLRLSNLLDSVRDDVPATFNFDSEVRKATRSKLGRETLDEVQVYTAIRKATNPNFYRRRLERLFNLYQFDRVSENAKRVQELLDRHSPHNTEEEMIKQVVMDIGPELSSILPRHRMTAFMKKYRLNEGDVAFAFPNNVYSSLVLENNTEDVFDELCRKYGNEPRPTSYLFPPVAYEPDRRTYLLENLSFPQNIPGGASVRDDVLRAREKRPPFTHSPYERELYKTSKSGRELSEIEVLQEKHEPEFRQIIPSIADALTRVIEQHTRLGQPRDERFDIYETSNLPTIQLQEYINRIAQYTYISPSSMLAAVIFLDRLCERYPSFTLSDRNIFKLFFGAVRVASKVVDLRSLNNKNFAAVGGVGNRHLNELEDAFLKYIKFDLFLAPPEFAEYSKRLNPPITSSSVPRHIGTDPAQLAQEEQRRRRSGEQS